MWDYIVLGQIPGTAIQVTFNTWLLVMVGFVLGSLLYLAIHTVQTPTFEPVEEPVVLPSARVALGWTQKLLLAFQIRRVLQTAAYTQWLTTRRHIQA